MKTQSILWYVGALVLLLLAAIPFYRLVIRPWHVRWGASDAEVQAVLMGDEIVKGEVDQTTRAITIHSTPDFIWPWLLQMGQGRGGMYSYDWLENLAGCDIHTLDQIQPDLQNLQIGDPIKLGPQQGLPYYRVVLLEPEKALVLRSVNPTRESLGETWGFYLVEQDSLTTRLIIRHRTPPSEATIEWIVNGVFDPIVFLMEHRMLSGIRDHAEALTSTTLIDK